MLTRRSALTLLAAAPAALTLGTKAFAASPQIYAENGIAIDGSDAVAYFDGQGPVPGSSDHSLMWNGAQWLFSSADNLAAFTADPEAFAPQYGGYCAWAAAQGYVAPTHPNAWTIYEGKLYLNANRRIRSRFEKDIPGFIQSADDNWPGILA